jgi:hypothetical protein
MLPFLLPVILPTTNAIGLGHIVLRVASYNPSGHPYSERLMVHDDRSGYRICSGYVSRVDK